MAEIRVLDKHTAELIAAGEVVERPASVAKELLENAIDAGATQITLSIVRGGIQQLQIADNGSGIEAEYIDKAFVRHATSKIASAEDLGHIHTLGFRGEALASIASVARVEVLTRTEADEYACCYRIEGGEPQGMEPGARPRGTTVTVNDLFYNTPARMKFLKKDVSEGTFVADIVLHEALSHPEIAFRFLRDGKQQFMTPGDGQLRSAAYAVLGREFARDLLPLDGDGGVYKVTGLVTPPRACRASRSAQHFYVNGRYVKNRTMMAALEKEGILDNTMIIFSSDNGPVLDDGYLDRAYELNGTHRAAGPLRGGKYSKFDGGTRIPFIVYSSALKHRGVSEALISQVDLYASFAHMLGIETREDSAVDSQDRYAALIGEDPAGRSELMTEDLSCGKMLRCGSWVYLSPSEGAPYMPLTRIETGLSKDPQLYNMDYDIGQQNNIAWDYADQVEKMEKRLQEILTSESTR